MQTQPQNSPWTNKEVYLLTKHYPNTNNEDIACIIGRSTTAIAHKASKLGLRKSEAFLNSSDSGRFRVQLPFRTRFINWLRSCVNW